MIFFGSWSDFRTLIILFRFSTMLIRLFRFFLIRILSDPARLFKNIFSINFNFLSRLVSVCVLGCIFHSFSSLFVEYTKFFLISHLTEIVNFIGLSELFLFHIHFGSGAALIGNAFSGSAKSFRSRSTTLAVSENCIVQTPDYRQGISTYIEVNMYIDCGTFISGNNECHNLNCSWSWIKFF